MAFDPTKFFNDPFTNIGMGILASNRPGASFGQAVGGGGLLGLNSYQQMLRFQQEREDKAREQQALQANQQWMANQGFAPGTPQWAAEAQFKQQFAQPDVPTGMRAMPDGTWQYDPAYLQGQERLKRAGAARTDINLNQGLKPPAGYAFKDPQNPWAGVAPLPGSEAEQKQIEGKIGISEAASKAREGIGVINSMLEHPGLEYAVGASSMLPIIPGTPAADFDALAKQLEGKAFLEAFETLKGGGQITQIEGEKATAAIGRLQRSQSEKEYKAALRELRNIYQRGVSRAERRLKSTAGGASQGGWSIEVEN